MDRRADGLCFKTSSRSKYDVPVVVVVYVAVVFDGVVGGCGGDGLLQQIVKMNIMIE